MFSYPRQSAVPTRTASDLEQSNIQPPEQRINLTSHLTSVNHCVECQTSNQYLDKKLEAHLKLDWYNEQAVKSEARRQANQPVRKEGGKTDGMNAGGTARFLRTHHVALRRMDGIYGVARLPRVRACDPSHPTAHH